MMLADPGQQLPVPSQVLGGDHITGVIPPFLFCPVIGKHFLCWRAAGRIRDRCGLTTKRV